MLFNSYQFFLFFGVVLLAYWGLKGRARLWLLFLATYVFYAAFTWWFVALPLVITAFDLWYGRSMDRGPAPRTRKLLLYAAAAVHFGVLGLFKYLGWFVESASELLDRLGLPSSDFVLHLVLPVGLSFYVFQSMGYCIDIYREKLEPERDPLVLGTFIAFFPQIAAGPISRGGKLLPQLRSLPDRLPSADRRTGIDLIILGLFRKVVIGDMCARLYALAFAKTEVGPFNTQVPVTNSGIVLFAGAVAFAAGVYGDFAGYSTMARGFAKLLGIDIPRNFAQPSRSKSYPELWRRWHITLMHWFRDYVYYPLWFRTYKHVPIRRPLERTAFATCVVFIGAGLWHGAGANWALWGLLSGLIVVADATIRDAMRKRRKAARAAARAAGGAGASPARTGGGTATLTRSKVGNQVSDGLQVAFTIFLGVMLAIVVAVPTLGDAVDVWTAILSLQSGRMRPDLLAAVAVAGVVIYMSDRHEMTIERAERARGLEQPPADRKARRARGMISDWSWGIRAGLMLAPIVIFSGLPADPFVYFRF